MTEAYEDGNYLVRVRAQVMTRDDSSGGWVPLGGGGLSNVSVRKRHPSSTAPHSRHASVDGPDAGGGGGGGVNNAPSSQAPQPKHEYLIYGKRISDQSIVLSCIIKKDFEYNKVMPTFHHWKTGDKKFGLTFQTAADARAFDKGVRTAVEELLDGLTDTFPLSSIHKYPKDVADDDVFMTLNLPIEAPPTESRMSGGDVSSGGTMGTSPHQTRDMHKIHYIQCQDRDLSPPVTKEQQKADNYSYVQLTAVHDYNYPVVDDTKGSVCRQDVVVGSKKRSLDVIGTTQTSMPACKDAQKKTQNKYVRARCRHCNKLFSEDSNGCGSCEYAPDCVRRGIDAVTCISCAQGMLYHCMADAEGDFALHPCECAPPAAGDDGCCKRWAGLTLLSVLVPCLWCYLPLRACHSCGVACGVCGGKHAAC